MGRCILFDPDVELVTGTITVIIEELQALISSDWVEYNLLSRTAVSPVLPKLLVKCIK